jgi:hypothetical protein
MRSVQRPRVTAQRGQAFLLLVLLTAVGVGAILYSVASPNRELLERDRITNAALAQAKDALIGYAAMINETSTRPGELPCPATNENGIASGPCNSLNLRVGRLPWKTLGLSDLRDGYGAILWYAVSNNFKNNQRIYPLNSDTIGEFSVTTGTAQTTGVIAIVFAPGPVVGPQQRSGVANQGNIANYLEGENANGDTIFTTNTVANSQNDKLLLITRENLMPAVERRVARELARNLRDYYTTHLHYPFASTFSDTVCAVGAYRGRVPTSCPSPIPSLTLPAWFVPNNWHQVLAYAVAPRCTPEIISAAINPASLDCNNTAAGPYLTVSGVSTVVQALLISAGPGLGQTRPCASISDCLEDAENTSEPDNQIYVKPVRSPVNNDFLVSVTPANL